MDDNYRLVKLISLVAWTDRAENKCGLRFLSNADRDRLSQDEGTAGHVMSQRYAGAVRYHQGKVGPEDELDRRQLPERTLEFVSNLSSDAITLLGELVKRSLSLGIGVDPTTLGRQWVADTTATCWRLTLVNHTDRFGQSE